MRWAETKQTTHGHKEQVGVLNSPSLPAGDYVCVSSGSVPRLSPTLRVEPKFQGQQAGCNRVWAPTSSPPSPPSLRRSMSETRKVRRKPVPQLLALPEDVLSSWEKENWIHKPGQFTIPYVPQSKRSKYGYDLPTHPRDAILKGKTLRHSPDSRRLNTKRDIDSHTIEIMREQLGDQDDIHSVAMKSSAKEANYVALDRTYPCMDEGLSKANLEHQRQQGALDLALPRKSSIQSEPRSSTRTDRKGSGVTFLLPDFTIIRGSLSPGQSVPESPDPDSSYGSFEWDNPSPFGGPLFAPLWNQTWNGTRPSSADEKQSASRKASQPELDIDLAKKSRPATLPSDSIRTNDNPTKVERKRLGVILDPRDVREELEKKFCLRSL
ncbi:unnamed protein product [Rhizoctonia solani]|uniref:Uncharacterized protein n=1 Tax=Rhizoctonia solani TaxID=456999 RepID=A0A8H3DSG6_9AGAM|nr:unnamed protein product [Rhizoctonia solani]